MTDPPTGWIGYDDTGYVFWCATCGGPAAHATEDHDRLTENLADPPEATT